MKSGSFYAQSKNKSPKPAMNDYVKFPLNYTGGKTKLLPQILPLFPKQIGTFVDLFCGGGNVGINVRAEQIIYNDSDPTVKRLLEFLKNTPADTIESEIDRIISGYGLSDSRSFGYEKYNCDSSSGLADFNKDKYLALRKDFNSSDRQNTFQLLTLIIYGFNNQIRFNKKGEFNLPAGKRDFNNMIRSNLKVFSKTLSKQNAQILGKDFRKIDTTPLNEQAFVYCDPPYLITTATYNERGGWTESDEKDLLKMLDELNNRTIRFALSNVMEHNGKQTHLLSDWAEKYKINYLNYSYNNSNYHSSAKKHTTKEVLITNY